jgi:putative membrane protein
LRYVRFGRAASRRTARDGPTERASARPKRGAQRVARGDRTMIDSTSPMPGPSTRLFLIGNAAATAAVMSFLVWLVYFNQGSPEALAASSATLPAVNALLNAASALLLGGALVAVKQRRYRLHAGLVVAALVASACFLCTYVYYHLHHGDTRFTGTGLIRPLYFTILISHIALSMVAFPMILSSLYFALTRRFRLHRKLSRYTWAAWMYVSVTGVIVYLMLH